MFDQSNHLVVTVILALTGMACSSADIDDAEMWREVSDDLPSGVLISVEVSTPSNGASLPQGPVEVTGFATIGEAEPVAQTTLAYVLDVSGSTAALTGCGGDANGDGLFSSILDCEITAAIALNNTARATGTVAEVGAAVFAFSGATADVRPGGVNHDSLTAPNADLDSNSLLDVDVVLRSIHLGAIHNFTPHVVGNATSYAAGLEAVKPVLAASARPNKVVVFVSDGNNNTAPEISSVLPMPAGTVIHTFAIGQQSACDNDKSLGSLQDIADQTGGTCTEVPIVANLPAVIPTVIAAEMTKLQLRVDSSLVPIDSITPALPEDGPAVLNYSTTILGLAPGPHTLCATAEGNDALGRGDVTECVKITVSHD